MKLYLIRHGISLGNQKKVYNGRLDEKLSQEGIKDLEEKKSLYTNLKVDYCYCSTLTRARQSWAILFPKLAVNEYRDDLVEMDFGDWTGMSYQDKFKELLAQGYSYNDLIDPDNGESYEQLFERTTNFLNEVLTKHHDSNCIVVLTHGLVISSLMYQHFVIGKSMYELAPANGLGFIIEFDEHKQLKDVKKIAL